MESNKMAKQLKSVMVAGTGSDVGKSVIAAGLCRIFKQDGYRPAPFKAQNMALNSYVTSDGLEIGRAQAVQADACKLECRAEMNPVLLKPSGEMMSQVVVMGKPRCNSSARDYFRPEFQEELKAIVGEAYDRLNEEFNPIVLEGAGSISELNLRDSDIVNMPMAHRADADVFLVADINSGGVFASVWGSIMLQTEEDKKRIKGIIINKFRGDMSLFADGRRMLEELCGVPVLGVIPFRKDIFIEEEDSVSLLCKNKRHCEDLKVNVAVVPLSHMSNFTDFYTLALDERVHLYFTKDERELQYADVILLAGSKNTIDDLREIKRNGCGEAIKRAATEGKIIGGICGGYQMMGDMVEDPLGMEGSVSKESGLGLLPIHTRIESKKLTRRTRFKIDSTNIEAEGYEIHQGETLISEGGTHFLTLDDGRRDGCRVGKNIFGCYIHGLFDSPRVIDFLFKDIFKSKGLQLKSSCSNYSEFKDKELDRFAEMMRENLDMELIYKILGRDD